MSTMIRLNMGDTPADMTQSLEAQQSSAQDRFPILCVMQLVPIDGTGKLLRDRAIDVVGKDLSRTEISFSHALPIPHRRGVLLFDHPDLGRYVMEVELAWTKIVSTRLRETGCRLIRKLTSAQLHGDA